MRRALLLAVLMGRKTIQDERLRVFRLLDSVELRDAGVVQAREDLGLSLELGEPVWTAGEGVQQYLERHLAVQLRVRGLIDLAL